MTKYDPFLHHIGAHDDNLGIWIQYKLMVEIAYKNLQNDEFNRSQTIIPLLHLMSHALELGLKENIAFLKDEFPDFRSNFENGLKGGYKMSHNGYKLFNIFKDYVTKRVLTLPNVGKEINQETKALLSNLGEFISDVNPKTSTYRYSHIVDKNGDVDLSIPRNKKIKIDVVYNNFMEAQKLLLYTQAVFAPWYDYRDFKVLNPEYSGGIGYLWGEKARFYDHPEYNIKWSETISWIEKHNVGGSKYFIKKEKDKPPTEEEIERASLLDDDNPFKDLFLNGSGIDDEYLRRWYHIETVKDREVYFDRLRNVYFEFFEIGGYHWTPIISEETFCRKYK